MRLFNTLTRREEPFAPSRGNTVRMYTCGLTVYARGHIGNFRTFVALDVLRRALEFEPVEFTPRATDHIGAMAGMIQALERNGHTYEGDGSIYFKIATFPEY